MAASRKSWEDALGVWLYAFEDVHLSSALPFMHDGKGWWSFYAPRLGSTPAMWEMLREGMELLELLELLARVAPDEARGILRTQDQDGAPLVPRFHISVDEDDQIIDPQHQQGLLDLFARSKTSSEYKRVKALLLEKWASNHDGRAFDRDVVGRVEVAIEYNCQLQEENEPAIYEAIRSLASETGHVGPDALPDEALQLFNELTMSGIRISHFYFVSLFRTDHEPAVFANFLANQLMHVGGSGGDRGVQSLDLNVTSFDVAVVHSLCSAIARSTSLRRLKFEVTDDDFADDDEFEFTTQEDAWWPWLAYAFFSRHTDHEITSVHLTTRSLTMDHIHAIRRVLFHANPLELLDDTVPPPEHNSAASYSAVDFVTFVESPVVSLGHHDAAALESTKMQLTGTIVPCQIICDRPEDPFIEFFLPGMGVCWADRGQVAETKAQAKRSAHPVRDLRLFPERLRGDAAQPMIELLQIIGGPVERLTMFAHRGVMNYNVCDAILPACPNLTYLKLSGMHVRRLDWLINAPSTCKLKTLRLNLKEGISKSSWVQFFGALSTKSHPLTQSLRELRISFSQFNRGTDRTEPEEIAICKLFIAMLIKNRLVQRCELLACSESTMDKYKARLLSHHNEPLDEAESPLPVSHKLAFLSVLAPAPLVLSPWKQMKISQEVEVVNNEDTTRRQNCLRKSFDMCLSWHPRPHAASARSEACKGFPLQFEAFLMTITPAEPIPSVPSNLTRKYTAR